jgi:PD-(D/E)XK nuclease superfamily
MILTTSSPPTKKQSPYIWASWLSPLLAGSSHCHWGTWFQANYKFEKDTDDDFLQDWTARHERLLHQRANVLEEEGYTVYLEDENAFRILGGDKRTTVAGKADIVAIRDDQVVVEDCKTGKKRQSDINQVLTYMLLLPAPGGAQHCRGKQLEGRLVYGGGDIFDISSNMLTPDFKAHFRELVQAVSDSKPARTVPSEGECKFCKASGYCSERVSSESPQEQGEHDLF